MSRAIYYRNLLIFVVFVGVLFATPYLFAQTTSPSLMRVNNARVQLFNRGDINQVNTMLEQGAIIRLPNIITENPVYEESGELDIYETLSAWPTFAEQYFEDCRLKGHAVRKCSSMYPRQSGDKILYPVKIFANPGDEGFDPNSSQAIGYVDLTAFLNTGSFNTVALTSTTTDTQGEATEDEEELSPLILLDNPPATAPAETVENVRDSIVFMDLDEGGDEGVTDATNQGGIDEELHTLPSLAMTPPPPRTKPEIDLANHNLGARAEHAPPARPADLDTTGGGSTTVSTSNEATTWRSRHQNCENIRPGVAAALGESVNSSRVRCYLDLFFVETTCQPGMTERAHSGGNNPHDGRGVCTLEADIAIRIANNRGPECMTINTLAQQTRCCASIMAKYSKSGSYFGPVRRGGVWRGRKGNRRWIPIRKCD